VYIKGLDYIVTGGEEGKLKLWDGANFKLLTEINAHTNCISQVIYSESLWSIFTASQDKRVKKWTYNKDKVFQNTKTFLNDQPLNSIAFLETTKYLIGGDSSAKLHLWRVDDGTKVQSYDFESTITYICPMEGDGS